MQIGILISSEPNGDVYAGADRLVEAAGKRGHEAKRFHESGFTFQAKGDEISILFEGKPLDPTFVFIYRPNFIEEPSLHTHVPHLLKQAGFRVLNGSALIHVTKNKLIQHALMHEARIPMPPWAIVKRKTEAVQAALELGFPVVLKTPFGTHGVGVFFSENVETLQPIVDYLAVSDKNPVVIEKFIAEAGRSDLRVFIVGNRVIAAMQRTAPEGDIRANAALGGVGTRVDLTEEEAGLALKVAQLFKLDIAGVDLLRGKDGPLVIEANANPGFKELERATGVDVVGAIIQEVERLSV